MKQIVHIHGGSPFDSYERYLSALRNSPLTYENLFHKTKWRDWLAVTMTDFDVLLPTMPNKQNARYSEWKIYFEKILPFLGNNVQLIGSSLGAIFLAKYLYENPLSTPVDRLILIAAPYDDATNEDFGDFILPSATGLEKSAKEIHLFHSKDDAVVPFTELAKFQSDLPQAQKVMYLLTEAISNSQPSPS